MKAQHSFLSALALLAAVTSVHAQTNITSTVTAAGNYTWTDTANWTGGNVPNSSSEQAVLNPGSGTPSGNITFTGLNGITLAGLVTNTTDPGTYTVNYRVGTSSETLTLNNTSSTTALISNFTDAGNLTISANLLLDDADGVRINAAGGVNNTLVINGAISGSSTILKESSGAVYLGGNNTFSGGITFAAGNNRGLVVATATNAFENTSGTITMATVSTHTGGIGTIATGTTVVNNTIDLQNTNAGSNNAAFRVGGTGSVLDIAGNIVNATGSSNISIARTVNPDGSNPSGAGTVKFSGTGYTVAKGVVFGDANANLEFAPASGVQTWSGAITGAAGSARTVTKSGNGTTILSGTNTYDPQTFVNAGTLLLNGLNQNATAATFGYGYQQGSTPSGHWQVESGGVLGGTGTIAGRTANNANVNNAIAVLVKSGGVLSPGDSTQANPTATLVISTSNMANPGTQRGLVMQSGAKFKFEFGGNGTTGDVLQFNGFSANNTESTVTFNNNTIDLDLWGTAVDGTYTRDIMTFFSGEGTGAVMHGFTSGLTLNILNPNITGASILWGGVNGLGQSIGVSFTVTAIPEPSTVTAAILLLGIFVWTAWKRRQKTAKAR